MIRTLLNGVVGFAVVMMFLLQTAQGSHQNNILLEESEPKAASPTVKPEDNQAEPLADKTQSAPTLPNDMIGLPTDLWENYILNQWLLPEHVATVSKVFGQLAKKMSRSMVLFPDHQTLDHPSALYYKDFQSINFKTLHFVNLCVVPGFQLSVDHIKYFLGGNIQISYLDVDRNAAFSGVIEDASLSQSIVSALCDELKANTSLVSLNLNGCELKKTMIETIFESLKQNKTLKELNLNHTGVDSAVAEQFQTENPQISLKYKEQYINYIN